MGFLTKIVVSLQRSKQFSKAEKAIEKEEFYKAKQIYSTLLTSPISSYDQFRIYLSLIQIALKKGNNQDAMFIINKINQIDVKQLEAKSKIAKELKFTIRELDRSWGFKPNERLELNHCFLQSEIVVFYIFNNVYLEINNRSHTLYFLERLFSFVNDSIKLEFLKKAWHLSLQREQERKPNRKTIQHMFHLRMCWIFMFVKNRQYSIGIQHLDMMKSYFKRESNIDKFLPYYDLLKAFTLGNQGQNNAAIVLYNLHLWDLQWINKFDSKKRGLVVSNYFHGLYDHMFLMADLLSQEKRLTESDQMYMKIVAENEIRSSYKGPRYYDRKIKVLMKLKKFKEALECSDEWISRKSVRSQKFLLTNSLLHVKRAEIYLGMEEIENAKFEIDKSIELYPKNVIAIKLRNEIEKRQAEL